MKNSKSLKAIALIMTMVFILTMVLPVFAEDNGLKKRSDIPDKYKWNLSEVYKDKAAFEKDFAKIEKELIPAVAKFKGKLKNPTNVQNCFKADDALNILMEKLYVYSHLMADLDANDSYASEIAARTETLNSKMLEAEAYITPELLSLSDKTFNSLMKSSKLTSYKYVLEKLKARKAHTLSKAEEALLASASDMAGTPTDIYEKATRADMKFDSIKDEDGNDVAVTNGKWSTFLYSSNRDIRKNAFFAHYGSFDKLKNTLAASYTGQIKSDIFFSKARKYNSSLEAALAADQIPVSVYDNLVNAVNKNLDGLHKYVSLRKKVMNIDKVHVYDMYVPMVDDYTMNVKYDDAQKMILDGLKPLGGDYLNVVKKAFANRWIDVYETDGKATGAYQWGYYGSHPYLLLNYNDTADDMLTISHEMGHAMHAYYSYANQPYKTANAPIFTAEVASTTNELIMTQYLLKNAKNNQEKLYVLNSLIENIRGSVYTQIMYAEYEKLAHERVEKGEALSTDALREIWGGLMKKYYGSDFEVDPLVTLWWSRIPHFYNSFYVYKYATGMAAAYPLSEGLVSGDKNKQKAYLEFLKAGDSNYPIEILKDAGVDMSTTKPVDELLKEFNDLVGQMEQILKEEGKIR